MSGMGAGAADSLHGVEFGAASPAQPGSPHRLEHGSTQAEYPPDRLQHTVADPALGEDAASGLAHSQSCDWSAVEGLATALRSSGLLRGNVHRSGALSR